MPLFCPVHRLLPAEGSGTVVTGAVTLAGAEADHETVENESRKSGYCTFDTIGAAPVPRRSTTMEPETKGEGAIDGDADGVVVDEGGGVVDGVAAGDALGVTTETGANWIPRNMAFGFAAATNVQHVLHDEYAVPTAWLSSYRMM